MEIERLICIICPNSCEISVHISGKKIKKVEGNLCKRGEEYAIREITCPERTVTSTVLVLGGREKLVSVKTSKPIPKEKIFDVMREIKRLRVKAPVGMGDILLRNVCNTGVDIVATKNVEKSNQ